MNPTDLYRDARTVALAFTLAIVAAGPCLASTAPSFSSAAPAAQTPAPARPAKDPQREVLDQAFRSLEEELKAAIGEYQVAVQNASKQNLPREQYPKAPAPEYYSRFEDLALQDQPDALRWCIGIVSSIGFPMDEAIARKIVLYEHMVKAHANSPWINDIISFLASEGTPVGVGIDRATGFLADIAKAAATPDVRAKALWTKAQLYTASKKPEHEPLANKTWRELIQLCPGTNEARRAGGLLYRAEHLQIGMTAPDVATVDPDGAAFKLSDFRGKVTVVVFWGFWCPPCRAMLPHEKALVERLKDKPFALVGVNTDQSKDDFKRLAKENGVSWKVSWQGSRQGPWAESWGITSFPAIFVLDAKGVIRVVDVRGEELSKAVDSLLAELESKKSGDATPPK